MCRARQCLLGLLVVAITLPWSGPEPAQAAFPGANGKLAFTRTVGFAEIYVMNADGSSPTNRSNSTGREDSKPAWSSDGARLAFESLRDNLGGEIYVMKADGTQQTRLTYNGNNHAPAWSPDGTRIAFCRSGPGTTSDIYVMNADGSEQTRLTNDAITNCEPAWSPDGSKIAFYSTRDSLDPDCFGFGCNSEVYVMNSDGSEQTNLTNNPAEDLLPDWSPDAAKIAFVSSRDGNQEIYLMDADGSSPTRLTNQPNQDLSPAWSPDGTKIAFHSNRDGAFEIYVMNADGSGQARLTNNGTFDGDPDWQPVSINIAKVASYRPPRACFEVRDPNQIPWFHVCDNNVGGPPEVSSVCLPDETCRDDDPAIGFIKVPVSEGDYRVVEIAPPVNHAADPSKQACDTGVSGCVLTFMNTPLNNPWFPWDFNKDGFVNIIDIAIFIRHFGQVKPPP